MDKNDSISFGDHVRIRSTESTVDLGLAGLVGQVDGETTPSVTGVDVIGEMTADCAFNAPVKLALPNVTFPKSVINEPLPVTESVPLWVIS